MTARRRALALRLVGLSALLLGVTTAHAADPQRGARLFATPPQPGLLACADCHSEDPLTNNFGNIFSGRNAPSLIQRAVDANTGGMGYIRDHYAAAEFADIAAYLGIDPGRVDFGRQIVGGPAALRSVTVRASSKAVLSGLRLAIEGPFSIRDNRCAAQVPARTSCTVDLAFDATAPGQALGQLIVEHDGTPTPVRVGLSAEAALQPPAQVLLAPPVLRFDAAASRGRVRLSNPSTSPLLLHGASTHSSAFAILGGTCRVGTTLQPGASCSWVIGHDASAAAPAGGASAELQVRHDGVGGGSTVQLVASAPAPQPPWVFDARGLDFGVLDAGIESAPQRVRLHHVGSRPLRLLSLDTQGAAFRVADAGGCRPGVLLQPGQGCVLAVVFQGQRHQLVTDELRVWAEGHAEPARLGLVGRSVSASAWPELVPRRLAWSGADEGAMVARFSRLTNRGTAPLRVRGAAIDGPDAAAFVLDGDCRPGRELAPGEACSARVRPLGGPIADRQARLRVQTDAAGAVPGAELVADLKVRMAGASLHIDRTALDLEVASGAASGLLTLQHRGALATTLRRIDRVGDFAAGFQLAGSCVAGRVLSGDDACSVEVTHAPLTAGRTQEQATLVFESSEGLVLVALRAHAGTAGASVGDAPTAWRIEVVEPFEARDVLGTPLATLGGEGVRSTLRLVHRGTSTTVLRGVALQGEAWSDFSIDASQGCRVGDVLAPGAGCALHLRFHPAAPGLRMARLVVWLDGMAPAGVPIEGRALSPASGWLMPWPEAQRFDAAEPAPAERQVWVLNGGAGTRELQAGLLRGPGFAWRQGGASPCTEVGVDLLADDGCTLLVSWTGAAAAAEGGRWTVTSADDAAEQSLSIGEAPRVLNRGAGALGSSPADAWAALGLLLAAVLLARRGHERRSQ